MIKNCELEKKWLRPTVKSCSRVSVEYISERDTVSIMDRIRVRILKPVHTQCLELHKHQSTAGMNLPQRKRMKKVHEEINTETEEEETE
jgi:hypothetical protein